MSVLFLKVIEADDLPKMDVVIYSCPVLDIKVIPSNWRTSSKKLHGSKHIDWNSEFKIPIKSKEDIVHFEFIDYDGMNAPLLVSTYDLPIKDVEEGKTYEDWYEFKPEEKIESGGKFKLMFKLEKEKD